MGTFEGVLIASDLDGTLLGTDHSLSEGNLSALKYFMKEGGKFAIATGRSRAGVECLRPWEYSNAPAVLSNGGMLFDYSLNKTLYIDILSPFTVAAAKKIQKHFPAAGLEVHCPENKYVINPNEAINTHLQYIQCAADIVPSLEAAEGDWIKVLFVDEPDVTAEIGAWTYERFKESICAVFSNQFMFEIQNKDTNKGSGVKKLAELLGIKSEHVFTAGDAGNDMDMLLAFESFAPANAEKDVITSVNHVLPHCDDNAIAAMIDFLLCHTNAGCGPQVASG